MHFDSLYCTSFDENISFNLIEMNSNSNLLFCLTQCALAEELSFFYFSSRKRPESWPRIEIEATTDEEDMSPMEADRVGSGCDELGHGEGNK